MKLKDMTENIKTRSAEQLSDENLENVSGGGRLNDSIYYIMCEYRCAINRSEHYRNRAVDYLKSLNGICPKCEEGKLVIVYEGRKFTLDMIKALP